ncbi:MAG TPA: glycoside hydrolase 43 family protein [Pyrinomonadaceae bacterium]|nr:glycoside hydrolase 43 family protein [Pyrinomonadaceae bacterium]
MNPIHLAVATVLLLVVVCPPATTPAQTRSPLADNVWLADNGDGTYRNPIIHADYSDPDAIRVNDDYYLVASSFNCVPGLPILHSKDLVNWEIIGHALRRQPPEEIFRKPQHGNGVWAPAIRYHNGEFFIFYPDPDRGIYMVKAQDAGGPWSEPILVKQAKGWIDPCPLWDSDGKAYLVSAMAASRSGIKSILIVSRMSEDGTKLLDDGAIVFDGHDENPTVEGPKFYRRNDYYYIFAPAGGVENGWQLVLRSKNVYGPYEARKVLAQGKTAINGPHQGAWVDTQTNESWFIHFQDKGAYGRIVHLQPMKWAADWPVIGVDPDGDGVGEPVLSYKKPNVGRSWPVVTPSESDEFNQNVVGSQWQWQANPASNWAFPASALGFIRLFNVPLPADYRNFWDVPNLMLQKFPAAEFTATTKLTFTPRADNEKTGLVVMGLDYAYLSIQRKAGDILVAQTVCKDADRHTAEVEGSPVKVRSNMIYLRVTVAQNAICRFSFSVDGVNFSAIGEPFTARPGRWIGAKVGIFAVGAGAEREMGYTDFDWFRVQRESS